MKVQPAELVPRHWRSVRLILEKILPRGIRKEMLDALDEKRGPLPKRLREAAVVLVNAYRVQAVAAFNKYAFLAESGLVVFTFAAASWPAPLRWPLLLGLAAILCGLTIRDAYTHLDPSYGKMPPMLQYYLDSAGDAAAAGVFLFAAETLTLQVSPALAFPGSVLYRGAAVCLPLISTLRLVLRPKPDPEAPLGQQGEPAIALLKRTWRLNLLWMMAFYGLILQNVSDDPNSKLDMLRGYVPVMTIAIWVVVQRNALARRDNIETVFSDWKKKMKARLKETLPQGLRKGEPLYWWYVVLQIVIFVELAAGLLEVLWPWLSGKEAGFLRPGICLVVFTTTVLSWRYVKASNRAAARAVQAEIDE